MRKLSLADKLRASGGARVWTQVVWYLQHDSYEFVQWNSSYSNSDIVHQACVLINCFLGKWLKLGSHRKFHKGYMWILLGMQVDKVSLLPQVTKHHLLKNIWLWLKVLMMHCLYRKEKFMMYKHILFRNPERIFSFREFAKSKLWNLYSFLKFKTFFFPLFIAYV